MAAGIFSHNPRKQRVASGDQRKMEGVSAVGFERGLEDALV
jgi:hypothetical protein